MSADLGGLVRASLPAEMELFLGEIKNLADPLNEEQFWRKPINPGNSFGHLVLHLTGNLNHFAGAQLGGTGYVRDREREFTEPNPPSKAEAMARLDEAVATYRRVVESLPLERFATTHPEARFGTVLNTLVHVLAHFSLHRGQMTYIARLVQQGA